jgi:hypothetical protein
LSVPAAASEARRRGLETGWRRCCDGGRRWGDRRRGGALRPRADGRSRTARPDKSHRIKSGSNHDCQHQSGHHPHAPPSTVVALPRSVPPDDYALVSTFCTVPPGTERAHRTSPDGVNLHAHIGTQRSWCSTRGTPVLAHSGKGGSASFCAAPDRHSGGRVGSAGIRWNSHPCVGVDSVFSAAGPGGPFRYSVSGSCREAQHLQRSRRLPTVCLEGREAPLLEISCCGQDVTRRRAASVWQREM